MGKPEDFMKEISNSDISPDAQASKLLEQALMEMDGIISGSNTAVIAQEDKSKVGNEPGVVRELSWKLTKALQNSVSLMPPDPEVRDTLLQWIQMSPEYEGCVIESRLNRNNMELQIQVLSEQIDAQTEKISDLEKMLQEKQFFLLEMENKLQREILSRSALETQKLELLSIVHELNLTSSALGKENAELRNFQSCFDCSNRESSKLTLENSDFLVSEKSTPKEMAKESTSRHIEVYHGSLPRQQYIGKNLFLTDVNGSTVDDPRGISCGRSPSYVGIRARGQSVPNLENEKLFLEDGNKAQSPNSANKNKGIWKILNLMKRSVSGDLNDRSATPILSRGGVRATTGGRLGWSEPYLTKGIEKPLNEWKGEDMYIWLQELGLDQYIQDAKKWIKNDQQLQEANFNISELEKYLNIKNSLHRKKLHLALIDLQDKAPKDPYLKEAGQLDTSWILRWLDDIGLPQHKEQFLINKIDGRVLHRLTLDDIGLLHITSMLHVTSIKRGIQVLRQNNFNPNCLQRRSLAEDANNLVEQISLWTTHRVMEWLRSVDLAEYAPNLRGAGVHGGLMVYETKFTSDLLATLLSIPPGKTLLRRHLNTRFKELLGSDILQEKRDAATTIGYVPLTPSTKFKTPKKSQFSLKRKSDKGDKDYGDLVCPLDSVNDSDEEEKRPIGSGCLS